MGLPRATAVGCHAWSADDCRVTTAVAGMRRGRPELVRRQRGCAAALPPLASDEDSPHWSPLVLVVVSPLRNSGDIRRR
jgi:hypothetical protein